MKKFFSLIEIMLVIAIIAILTAVAVPSFTKNREAAFEQQRNVNIDTVTLAKERYQLDTGASDGTNVTFDNIKRYLMSFDQKADLDVGGKSIVINPIGTDPVYR